MAPAMRAFALGSLLVSLAVGCGGSSSETPPPLEPDEALVRYTGPRFPKDDGKAVAAAPEPDEDDLPARPQRPARSTWGSGRPAPAPAPTLAPLPDLTSPNALPPRPAN
jgi:hypothetical protein